MPTNSGSAEPSALPVTPGWAGRGIFGGRKYGISLLGVTHKASGSPAPQELCSRGMGKTCWGASLSSAGSDPPPVRHPLQRTQTRRSPFSCCCSRHRSSAGRRARGSLTPRTDGSATAELGWQTQARRQDAAAHITLILLHEGFYYQSHVQNSACPSPVSQDALFRWHLNRQTGAQTTSCHAAVAAERSQQTLLRQPCPVSANSSRSSS